MKFAPINAHPSPGQQPADAAAPAGQPLAAGRQAANAADGNPAGAGLQDLRRQVEALEVQMGQARPRENLKPSDSALAQALHGQRMLQQRWEKQITNDHFGTRAWVTMRRNQLRQLPGGEVAAEQYGLSFARDLPPKNDGEAADPYRQAPKPHFPRLDINHDSNAVYQRNTPTAHSAAFCHALYQQKFPQDPVVARAFVNSPHLAKKLLAHLKVHIGQAAPVEQRVLADGIVALACSDMKDFQALDDLMNVLGGRASPYQILRAHTEQSGKSRARQDNPRIDNTALIHALRGGSDEDCVARLRQVPAHLGTATMANTAADLLESFSAQLLGDHGIVEQHRRDPVVANALQYLKYVAASLPLQATDSARFGNAYRAMLEEMQVVLSAVRPYQLQDFKAAAAGRARAALAPEHLAGMVEPEAFLTSCGMQALTQSLNIARGLGKGRLEALTHGDKESPLYYEVDDYLNRLRPMGGAQPDHQATFHATLGDSFPHAPGQPQAGWTMEDVLGGIRQQLQRRGEQAEPLTVVIDSTIEHAEDMPRLLAELGPALANDQLRLLFCRSHQKFANLGSSKVMGGSVLLLGADTPKNRQIQQGLRNEESAQGWFDNDESQLLTHLARVAQQREPEMLQAAVENARFVAAECFHGEVGHAKLGGHDANMPFALFPTFEDRPPSDWPGFTFKADGAQVKVPMRPSDMLDRDVMRDRFSFGFTESNIGSVSRPAGYNDHMLRVSMGQETKPELIERFWMPSRQMQPGLALLDNRAALDEVTALLDAALAAMPAGPVEGLSLRQKMQAVARHEAAASGDVQGGGGPLQPGAADPDPRRGYTINKIASVACHLAHVAQKFDLGPALAASEDRQPLDELLHALIDAGMPGVSPLARERIIGLQCTLLHADMQQGEAPVRHAAVQRLLHTLEHSGLNPTLGIFNHPLPDRVYQELPPTLRDKVVHRLFAPLETQAKMNFLVRHKMHDEGVLFLQHCAGLLQHDLKKPVPSPMQRQWQDRLLKQLEASKLTPA